MLLRWMLRQSDKIVVLSQSVLNELQSISSNGVLGFHPLYDNYTEFAEDCNAVQDRAPTVLFFGLIKPYKGLDVLLRAMSLVKSRIPDIRLLIAGEVYGSSAGYDDLIRSLGSQETVEKHFRFISESEIASFFRRSDVCVLPYKAASQSGVIATAYSFRLPVIASSVGGLSEYIDAGKTGLLVAPNNPEALAESIVRYFQSGLKEPMSAEIPAFCNRYSWKGLAELILKD